MRLGYVNSYWAREVWSPKVTRTYKGTSLTSKCPPPICFKFTGVKGDGKELVFKQKLAAKVDNYYL